MGIASLPAAPDTMTMTPPKWVHLVHECSRLYCTYTGRAGPAVMSATAP